MFSWTLVWFTAHRVVVQPRLLRATPRVLVSFSRSKTTRRRELLVGTKKKILKTESDSFRKEPLHIIRPPRHFFAIPTHSPTHPHPLLTPLDSRCRCCCCCCYRILCTRRPVGLVCLRSLLPSHQAAYTYIHPSLSFFFAYHLSGAYLADATIARIYTYACCSLFSFIYPISATISLSLARRFYRPWATVSRLAPLPSPFIFDLFFYLCFSVTFFSLAR